MLYEYKSKDGHVIEREVPMTNAPPVGHMIVHQDKAYYRIMSPLATPIVQADVHFTSYSRPRFDKFHKGEFNAQGQPLFSKRAEVNELVARANHNDPGYDGGLVYD